MTEALGVVDVVLMLVGLQRLISAVVGRLL